MELHIKKVLAEAIGFAALAKFGFDKSWDNWKKSDSIDLARKDDDEAIAIAHPTLSGRDVKNLLKLAMLINGTEPISPTTIEFVKQFKPTKEM